MRSATPLLAALLLATGCLSGAPAESTSEFGFEATFASDATHSDHERARILVETRGGEAELADSGGAATLVARSMEQDACVRARAAVEALARVTSVTECGPA